MTVAGGAAAYRGPKLPHAAADVGDPDEAQPAPAAGLAADPEQAVRERGLPPGFSLPQPEAPPPAPSEPAQEGMGWPWQLFSRRDSQRRTRSVAEQMQKLYTDKLLPIERDSDFHRFHQPELPPAYFSSQPMILTIGQYSTGKTTFIRHLLRRDYPGLQIGPEPTTDRFVAVCYGEQVQAPVPGNALVYDQSLPFTPLSNFGNAFLSRLECARLPSAVLQGVTFIDTPGVLSGEKQRIQRGYDFDRVISWFVEHAAMIILFFDAHKLDISDEFQRCIASLAGHQPKVRIILNKADKMTPQQLLRVHGALMWSLGKIINTPEVARVYIGSFWDEPLDNDEHKRLFEQEAYDLYTQIEHLPHSSSVQKMSDLSKRARNAKAHAFLLDYLHSSMPTLWGHAERQKELIQGLESVYVEVARQHSLPVGDFPDVEMMRAKLSDQDFTTFKKLDTRKMASLERLLAEDIPALQTSIAAERRQVQAAAP